LRALEITNGAFHLELIEDRNGELHFLEIGARVGGGEIPFIMHDLFGVDLVGEWLRIEVQEPPIDLSGANRIEVGGFLMIPEPEEVPCRVIYCTSLKATVPFLYREILPQPGEIFDGGGGYSHISGRFHFQGPREARIEASIHQAIAMFELVVEPIAESSKPQGEQAKYIARTECWKSLA
jgi:Biotin carboxylase